MKLKRLAMFFAFLILIPATLVFGESNEKDIEEFLKKGLVDNIGLIRNFYEGNNLRFDSQGKLISKNSPGIWTVSGFFQPKKVKLSKDSITLTGKRLYWTYNRELREQQLIPVSEDTKINIKRSLEQNDVSVMRELMFRIFLLSDESLVEHVPAYWQNIVRNKFKPVPDANMENFEKLGKTTEPDALKPISRPWPECPEIISTIPPEYSEEARRLRLSGIVSLLGVVDVQGNIKINEVFIPLGAGLEESAIRTIEKTWKFRPALRDGIPAETRVVVEVRFLTPKF